VRTAVALAVLLLGLGQTAGPSVASTTVSVTAIDLEGVLVAALAAEGKLWLLVRPAGEPDGPRRLLRLDEAAGPTPGAVASALPGWIKTLVAFDLGSGPELLVGGLGEIATLGALAAPSAVPRRLLAAPDVDLRSLAPQPLRRGVEPWLAVASAGRTRVFTGAEGGLQEVFAARLPVAITPEGGGLRVASPPGTAFDRGPGRLPLLVFGPEPRGRTRLRTTLLDPEAAAGDTAREAWSQLPGPERVEDHRVVTFDGEPYLVVRTQGSETVNALEKQRLRVLPLAADPSRAGARPTFAVEVDSRRWHEARFAAADVDGDGRDDLVVVRPEGLRGKSLVVEAYDGRGSGRFARSPRRRDLQGPFAAFDLAEPLAAGQLPVVVTVAGRRLDVHPLQTAAGRPVAAAPRLRTELPATQGAEAGPDRRQGQGTAEIEPGFAVLGRVGLGAGEAFVAVIESFADGYQRLYLVR
jgi:hypothetical protein